MLDILKKWFSKRPGRHSEPDAPALRKTGTHAAPLTGTGAHAAPPTGKDAQLYRELANTDDDVSYKIESAGPGKNVLIRNKFVREDTGTYETLKILDDSLVDSGEEKGIDPYNTGGFDRSRNWDKRFGK